MAIFHVWCCDLDGLRVFETLSEEDGPPEPDESGETYTCVLSYQHEPSDPTVWHDVVLSAVSLNSWEVAHAVYASELRMLDGGEWWTAEGRRLWDKL